MSDNEQVKQIEAELASAGIETPQAEEPQHNTLTEFEQEQHAKGWNPGGPKSAEEWARSEPLYEEIKRRGKENKQLQRTLESLKDMLDKKEQLAYNRAIADLTAQRDSAIQQGDANRVHQIDQEAMELQNSMPVIEPQAVREFKEKHSDWFEGTSVEDIKMQAFTRYQDSVLIAQQLPPDQHMKRLEEEVIKAFPDYFNKSQNVQAVESSGGSVSGSSRSKKHTLESLTETQRRTAKEFARLGVMTVDKYIDELVKMGDLK